MSLCLWSLTPRDRDTGNLLVLAGHISGVPSKLILLPVVINYEGSKESPLPASSALIHRVRAQESEQEVAAEPTKIHCSKGGMLKYYILQIQVITASIRLEKPSKIRKSSL